MKRITALFLTAVMLLSCFTFVSAAEIESDLYEVGTDAVLAALGVELPYAFAADDNIKKEEFVYLIMKATNISFSSNGKYLEFPDVKLDAWSHDAIVTAREMGYIAAQKDDSFGVNDSVSTEFAVKMAMSILGFDKIGLLQYPKAYSNLVNACGYKEILTYKDAQNLIYTMLLCSYVEGVVYTDKTVEYEIIENRSYMEYVFDVKRVTGRMTGNQYTKLGGGSTNVGMVEIDGIQYKSLCGDLREYLGYYADFFVYEKNSDVAIVGGNIKNTNEEEFIENGELFDVVRSGATVRLDYERDGKERKLSIPITCDFVYNGKVTDFSLDMIKELISTKPGTVKIVECNNKCTVFVTAYETVIVDGVSESTRTITGKYGEHIVLPDWEDEECYINIIRDDEKLTFADIKQDDVIMIARNDNCVEIKVTNHSLAGIVTKITDKGLSIDKVDYKYSVYYTNTVESGTHTVNPGMEATFFFNIYGQLVDFDDENIKYPGDYVFLIGANKKTEAFTTVCKIQVVTLNADMQILELAEKVATDIGVSSVNATTVIDSLVGRKELIYIEKNKEGKIFRLLTDGSRLVSLDAVEKARKFKRGTGSFLVDTNDANFPEFYTSNNTIALQMPISTASSSEFQNIKNYKRVTLSSVLKDAENATVQAYNFDDFNMPEIVLLRKAIVADTEGNTGLCLVTGFGETMDESGDLIKVVYVWNNGSEMEIPVDNDSVLSCTVTVNGSTTTRNMVEGDIVRFFYDNSGVAFANQWIENIESGFAVSASASGKNNGNAYVIGTVADQNDGFLKLRLSGGDTMVFYKNATVKPTIYNSIIKNAHGGVSSDLVKGDLVMLRVYYTSITDIIMKKIQ